MQTCICLQETRQADTVVSPPSAYKIILPHSEQNHVNERGVDILKRSCVISKPIQLTFFF